MKVHKTDDLVKQYTKRQMWDRLKSHGEYREEKPMIVHSRTLRIARRRLKRMGIQI